MGGTCGQRAGGPIDVAPLDGAVARVLKKPNGRERNAWPSCEIVNAQGKVIGLIKYGEGTNTLSAHCLYQDETSDECCHGLCRMDRTANASRIAAKSHQGRPLGFLIAWLLRSHRHATRKDHFYDREIPHAERASARQWAKTQPAIEFFLDKERHVKRGEPEEPLAVAGA